MPARRRALHELETNYHTGSKARPTKTRKGPPKRPSLCTQPTMDRIQLVRFRGGCNGLGSAQIARDGLVRNLVHHQFHRLARSARIEIDGFVNGLVLLLEAHVVDI